MTDVEMEKKIAEFLTLMVMVSAYEVKGEYTYLHDPDRPPCTTCKSEVCAMIQRNNNLRCWRVYAKTPDCLAYDLSTNNNVENNNNNNATIIDVTTESPQSQNNGTE